MIIIYTHFYASHRIIRTAKLYQDMAIIVIVPNDDDDNEPFLDLWALLLLLLSSPHASPVTQTNVLKIRSLKNCSCIKVLKMRNFHNQS